MALVTIAGFDRPASSRVGRREALLTWLPFRHLATAQAAHAAGDGIVAVALASTLFFAVPVREARPNIALYLALTMTPFALLSPLVGPWLDRRAGAYRQAIALSAAGRLALAVLLSSRTERVTLYPLAFGLLLLSRVHGVSRSSLVPDVLPPGRHLMWGNAWLAVISVLAGAVGAAIGALATALAGPRLTLWIAAIAFAAIVVAAIRLPRSAAQRGDRSTLADSGHPLSARLLAGGLAMGASRAAVGFLTFMLAFVLRQEGETGEGFAVVIAAAGVGGFVGSTVAPALRGVLGESVLLLVSLGGIVPAALWASVSVDLSSAAVVAALVGFSAGAGRLAFDSLLQHDAPEVVRGRAFSRYETVFQLWWVAGAGLATAVPFGSAVGMRVLAVIAAGGVAASVRGLLRRPAGAHASYRVGGPAP